MDNAVHPILEPPFASARRARGARATGFLILVLALLGMYAPTLLQSLVVPGDAVATAGNILAARPLFGGSLVAWLAIVAVDVALALAFYLLLEPAGRALALTAAAFRLVYAAILGALLPHLYAAYLLLTGTGQGADSAAAQRQALLALDTFGVGFLVALVFFGVHLLALGVLLGRSRAVPRPLSLLVVAAGIGYIADSLASIFLPGYGGLVSAALLAPAVLGEVGLGIWLLAKGIATPRGAPAPGIQDARPVPGEFPIANVTGGVA